LSEPGVAPAGRLQFNTLVNLAGFVLPIAVSIVTVPRYLTLVGPDRYGVLVIVWIMLGYFGVFDLGLGRATAQQVARAVGDPQRTNTVFWTATGINTLLGVVGGLVLVPVAYVLIEHVFKFPSELKHEVVRSLPWLAFSVPLITVSAVFTGALQGRERFVPVNAIISVNGILFQLVPLVVAEHHGPNLVWLIASATLVQLVTSVLGFAACVRWISDRRPHVERDLGRVLLRFGGWVSVSGLIAPLLTIIDRLVVGAAVGAGGVTRYSVPFNLATRLWIIPNSVSRTIFPRLAMLPSQRAKEVAVDALYGLFVAMTPIVIVSLLLVEPFLDLWVGSKLGHDAPRIAAILLMGVWVNGLAYIPYTYLQAQGRPDLPAKLHLMELLPFLAVLWVGLKLAGVQGGALAWSVRSAGDAALLAWVSRIQWRIQPSFVVGCGLTVLSFTAAMLLPGSSHSRVFADAVLLAGTSAWTLVALPRTTRRTLVAAAASPVRLLRR
jgi:O-antigen/teichoic acid export membrane protein